MVGIIFVLKLNFDSVERDRSILTREFLGRDLTPDALGDSLFATRPRGRTLSGVEERWHFVHYLATRYSALQIGNSIQRVYEQVVVMLAETKGPLRQT